MHTKQLQFTKALTSGHCYVFPEIGFVAPPGLQGMYLAMLRVKVDHPEVIDQHIKSGHFLAYIQDHLKYLPASEQQEWQLSIKSRASQDQKVQQIIDRLAQLSRDYAYRTPPWFSGQTGLHILPDRFSHPALHQDLPQSQSIKKQWRHLQAQKKLNFSDNLQRAGGTLEGIIQQLPYIQQELGIDFLYLGPVFASQSMHGFDADEYCVDPTLIGVSQEHYRQSNSQQKQRLKQQGFDWYIDLASRIPVVQDIALNHVGQDFFAFQHVLKHGRDSVYADWFRGLTFDSRGKLVHWRGWWGYPEYIELNHYSLQVRNYFLGQDFQLYAVKQSAKWHHWIDQLSEPATRSGILANPTLLAQAQASIGLIGFWTCLGMRGWRLDVPNDLNRWDFWVEFRQVVKTINPDCVLIAECWDNEDEAQWLWGNTFDSVMNYHLLKSSLDFLVGPTGRRMEHLISKRATSLTSGQFARHISRLYQRHPSQVSQAIMNNTSTHDLPRVADLLHEDASLIKIYFALLAFMPGNMVIRGGDELGMNNHGAERAVDPLNRKPYDWSANQDRQNNPIYLCLQQVIQLRHRFPQLAQAELQFVEADNPDVVIVLRPGPQDLVLLINRSRKPQVIQLDQNGASYDALLSNELDIQIKPNAKVAIPGLSFVILQKTGGHAR